MKVYILVFLLTFLLSYYLPAKSDRALKWKLVLIFIPLFIFGALRVDLGNDYQSYVDYFDEFHSLRKFSFDEESHAEIGYQFLCFIMPSHRSILVLNSFLLCFALALFIYRNVPKQYIWIAILIIFFNVDKNIYGNMVGLRNGFSVTTFLLGSILIQRRKFFPFLLFTVVSVSFHTAAIFYLPLAYLIGRKSEISKTEIIIGASILVVLSSMNSVGLLNAFTPFLLRYFDRYELYIMEFTGHQGFLMVLSTIILLILISILFYNNRERLTPDQNSLCRLGILYIASLLMGAISMRAGYFYNVFFAGMVSVLFSMKGKNAELGQILCALTIAMSAYSMYLWMHAGHVVNNPLYTTYHTIFD